MNWVYFFSCIPILLCVFVLSHSSLLTTLLLAHKSCALVLQSLFTTNYYLLSTCASIRVASSSSRSFVKIRGSFRCSLQANTQSTSWLRYMFLQCHCISWCALQKPCVDVSRCHLARSEYLASQASVRAVVCVILDMSAAIQANPNSWVTAHHPHYIITHSPSSTTTPSYRSVIIFHVCIDSLRHQFRVHLIDVISLVMDSTKNVNNVMDHSKNHYTHATREYSQTFPYTFNFSLFLL